MRRPLLLKRAASCPWRRGRGWSHLAGLDEERLAARANLSRQSWVTSGSSLSFAALFTNDRNAGQGCRSEIRDQGPLRHAASMEDIMRHWHQGAVPVCARAAVHRAC